MQNIYIPPIPYVVPPSSKVIQKFIAAAAAAERSNSISTPPLIAPPAWVASTAYNLGSVVYTQGVQLLCWGAGTSGTSAPTIPTGHQIGGQIVDGTATWYYMSAIRTPTTSAFAPVVTFVTGTPSGLTLQYASIANAASFFISGGTSYQVSGGIRLGQVSVPSGGNVTSTVNGTGGSVVFYTDAPKFSIGATYPTTPCRVEVDDVLLVDGSITVGQTGSAAQAIVIDYSAQDRKVRKVRFTFGGSQIFYGVNVDPQSKVWAYTSPYGYRLACFGDSLTVGADGFPIVPGDTWSHQLGRKLGCSDVWNLGLGGTGFLNNAGGSYTFLQRISDATSIAPDILVIFGNHNDWSYADASQQAAIVTFLQTFRAACPNTIILVFGNDASATGPSTGEGSATQAELNIQAAVAAFADPLTTFIPVINDPAGSWINGTGNVGVGTGVGNSDLYTLGDNTHPSYLGINYFRDRIYAQIRNAIHL